jgi:hypothetical protein
MLPLIPLLANLLLAPVVRRSDKGFRPPQVTPSGSHAWDLTVLFKPQNPLSYLKTQPFKKGEKQYVDMVGGGSNGRKVPIFRPKGK